MTLLEMLKAPFLSKPDNKELTKLSVNNPENISKTIDDTDLGLVLRSIRENGQIVQEKLSYEDLIRQYNRIAQSPEGNEAINEIINEMYNSITGESIKLDLTNIDVGDSVKNKLNDAFEKIMNLLNFKNKGRSYIFDWYKDGIFNVECVYDNTNIKSGIKQILVLRPDNLQKTVKNINGKTEVIFSFENNDGSYLAFNSRGEITYKKEQIITINSGLKDNAGRNVGYLHPAIKPYNQVNMIEDIIVVYRLSRGTEKRIFKVNVGKLPKNKAMSYMQGLISRFKSTRNYNTENGTIDNDSHLISLSEDIWLPTKESTKDIDIDTLSSGQNLGELDDLNYFKNKLYKALGVPSNRFGENQTELAVSATEITRDEARFMNKIFGLRNRFNDLFVELLKRELISTGTMNEKEFNAIKEKLDFIYPDQTSFMEQRRLNSFKDKVDILQEIDDYVGKYFSKKFVFSDIFKFTEDEMNDIKEQIALEKKNGEYEEEGDNNG